MAFAQSICIIRSFNRTIGSTTISGFMSIFTGIMAEVWVLAIRQGGRRSSPNCFSRGLEKIEVTDGWLNCQSLGPSNIADEDNGYCEPKSLVHLLPPAFKCRRLWTYQIRTTEHRIPPQWAICNSAALRLDAGVFSRIEEQSIE